MSLIIHSFARLPSWNPAEAEWRQTDYNAHKFAHALKGDKVNGYGYFPWPQGRSTRLEQANAGVATLAFGEWGAEKISQLGVPRAILVPIPSSSQTAFDDDTAPSRLAHAIQQHGRGQLFVARVLRFLEPRIPARLGGTRNPQVLQANMEVRHGSFDALPIVLVDDVVTSGGHMLAAARCLQARGCTVSFGLSGASTVLGPEDEMFFPPPRDLDPTLPNFSDIFKS